MTNAWTDGWTDKIPNDTCIITIIMIPITVESKVMKVLSHHFFAPHISLSKVRPSSSRGLPVPVAFSFGRLHPVKASRPLIMILAMIAKATSIYYVCTSLRGKARASCRIRKSLEDNGNIFLVKKGSDGIDLLRILPCGRLCAMGGIMINAIFQEGKPPPGANYN